MLVMGMKGDGYEISHKIYFGIEFVQNFLCLVFFRGGKRFEWQVGV